MIAHLVRDMIVFVCKYPGFELGTSGDSDSGATWETFCGYVETDQMLSHPPWDAKALSVQGNTLLLSRTQVDKSGVRDSADQRY
ncbi:unnamed protein product [Calypogeia fissa]